VLGIVDNSNDHGIGESNLPPAFRAVVEVQQQAEMAFVGAISDLFNCGRPRRPQTREELRDGPNTNSGDDTTRADPVPDIRIDASHSNNAGKTAAAPSDTIPQLFLGDSFSHIGSLDGRDSIDGRQPTVRPSTDAVRSLEGRASIVRPSTDAVRSIHSLQYVPEEMRARRNESIDEKSKSGSGWQVEKQFLVTTNTPDSSSAVPKLSLDFAESSIVDLTPAVKRQDGASTPPTDKTTAPVEDLTPTAKVQAVAPTPVAKSEPEVEDVEKHVVDEAAPAPKTDEDHPFLPEPLSPQSHVVPDFETVTTPQPQHLEAVIPGPVSSEEETVQVVAPSAAPAQFLDLPIGMDPPKAQSEHSLIVLRNSQLHLREDGRRRTCKDDST
jgi:hypothetical protein